MLELCYILKPFKSKSNQNFQKVNNKLTISFLYTTIECLKIIYPA